MGAIGVGSDWADAEVTGGDASGPVAMSSSAENSGLLAPETEVVLTAIAADFILP